MIAKSLPRNNQKTVFLVGCACIGAYVAYRYWKKRELKSIDEGFDEVTKIDDGHERRILLLGFDGAGKTCVMNQVCVIGGDENSYTSPSTPTQGFVVYRLIHGLFTYNVWEIGGTEQTRKYWPTFLQDTDLLVFMVDASDSNKLSHSVSILKELLGDSRMDAVPILVIANKQDCPNALRPDRVQQALDLMSISPRKHKVEVIGCQCRPLPEPIPGTASRYNWYHPSIDSVRKKIITMATT